MNATLPPSDDDLHAYVDGQLGEGRRAAVEAWLAANPAAAERVRAWQKQRAALHAGFDAVLTEPVPQRLQQAARRLSADRRPLFRVAAAVGWLALGSVIGYAIRGSQPAGEGGPPPIARSAAIAHAVYAPEIRHPVEVGADQEAHLVQWLSKRLGAPLKVPHLAGEGYALVGGRLLPGESGPVAQFMYEDGSGKRLTLYVRTDATDSRETAFRYALEGQVGVFYWLDGRLGYALSGELPREKLLALAESAYKQLNP